jgi:hypothetical protein
MQAGAPPRYRLNRRHLTRRGAVTVTCLHREIRRRAPRNVLVVLGEAPDARQTLGGFMTAAWLGPRLEVGGPDAERRADLIRAAIRRVASGESPCDLIVLASENDFPELIAALHDVPRDRLAELPDLAVLSPDLTFGYFGYWRGPPVFEALIHRRAVTADGAAVAFLRADGNAEAPPYGVLRAIARKTGLEFALAGVSTSNAWTGRTISLLRGLQAEARPLLRGARLTVQYDDYAHQDIGSAAFGRRRGATPAAQLIPDLQFMLQEGCRELREAVSSGDAPKWEDRRPVVFWRGSPTTNFSTGRDEPVTRLEDIPRVAMCLALRDLPHADAALMGS